MDIYVEQIIAIKKTGKNYLIYSAIILLTVIITIAGYLFLTPLFVAIGALAAFGAYRLCSLFNIEYEYIVTNTTMDIDKIIAKSSRKRMISFEITSIQRIEKYTGVLPSDVEKDCFFACNKKDENAFVVYYKEEGKQRKVFVFAPNERVRESMKNVLPRYVGENL